MTEVDTVIALPEGSIRTELAHYLQLDAIRPSPYNPRKRFDEAALEQLADSIAAHGVQQAIVVRPVEPGKPGGARYEIVAGERRWRASKLLAKRGLHSAPHGIPAFVRELDDFAAREIALTENSHRNDLHPLEEAQAYENLLLKPVGGGDFTPPRVKGYTVEQLADKIGHKPNFVFGRLKLLELVQEAKDAFLDDKLQLKIAEALARLPAKEQERALPELLRGWAGEPFTHRQAIEHLRNRYLLKLQAAVFHITDPDLVPAAGPCTTCTKRSGANPDLFNGASSEDMCLDADCFHAKEQAHAAAKIAKAKAAGQEVVVGAAVKKKLGIDQTSDYSLRSRGYVNLDRPAEEFTGTKKTLRTLLGAEFQDSTLIKPEHEDQPLTVAKVSAVTAALKEKGLLKPSTTSAPGKPGKVITAADVKAKRGERIQDLLDARLASAMCTTFDNEQKFGLPETKGFLLALARAVYEISELEFDQLERAITGSPGIGGDWMADLAEEQLARTIMVILVGSLVASERWAGRNAEGTKAEEANTLASEIGFDLVALRHSIAEEVDAAIAEEISQLADAAADAKADAKAKPAAKKSGPRKAAAPKYRNADTGESWSGKGLQPKWLKVALANGKKLSDFEELTPEKALANAVGADTGKPANVVSPAGAWPFPIGKNTPPSPAA